MGVVSIGSNFKFGHVPTDAPNRARLPIRMTSPFGLRDTFSHDNICRYDYLTWLDFPAKP